MNRIHRKLLFIDFDNYQNDYDDFARGWSWVRRKQDNADEEWTRFISSLKRMLPWVVVQLIVSQFLKNIQSNPTVFKMNKLHYRYKKC